jgi:RNA-directed DNA polymerase
MTDSTKTDLRQATASRRPVIDPALSEDLLERVLTPENLRKAWQQVKANHGAPGVDGMTVEDFPAFAREHWPRIRQALRDETYQPAPVRRVEIPKRHGPGKRRLGIATVMDRVIQQAIAQVLGPLFAPGFSASSFGFRPRHSAHQAVKQLRIRKLNEYIRGWMQYFGLSQHYRPLPELDAWLRRRLRMCFWKQWRYVRTKVRELLKLGTAKKTAILTALSRKGPWHLSRTLATQTGMTNQWLTDTLGLVSIRAVWISLHYPS